MSQPLNVQVILGSTRPKRFGDKPAHYLVDELRKRPEVRAELVDLRDWPLPFFDQPIAPARSKGHHGHEIVANWAAKIAEADAFVMVAPEYNHGYTAVLKNALDWLHFEWGKKPVGFVSSGNAGGARAIEQLREVVIELDMVPIKEAIAVPIDVYLAAMNESVPVSEAVFKPLREGRAGDVVTRFLDALLAYATALRPMHAAR